MTDITFDVRVGGESFPCDHFEITGGCYGSVGHAKVGTSIAAMSDAKIDLYDMTTGSAGVTAVTVSAKVGDAASVRIFGGEYVSADWDMDQDRLTISARSWAGALVDQKRILTKIGAAVVKALKPLVPGQISTAGISNQNQTVAMIVKSIAEEFGFTPVLHIATRNPTIGTLYGADDHVFMPVPQSLWSVLTKMAQDTGYTVYDTPDKELVFGMPGEGGPELAFSWGVKPQTDHTPMRSLHLAHHPRRNGTFRVLVISYDPSKAQVALGRAVYTGSNYAGSKGLSAGLTSGPGAAAADKALAALDQGTKQIPLYTFHFDGLTQPQANDKAAAIANDIAKREFIASATIDGLPDLFPTQKVKLSGKVPSQFTTVDFFTSGFSHRFRMPHPDSANSEGGFTTHIKLLNDPEG